MRATSTNTSEEVEAFVRGENSTLAIDAHTIFELDDFRPTNSSWYDEDRLTITGGRGAGLTLRNLSVDNDTRAYLGLYSHVSIRFEDTRVPGCFFTLFDEYLTDDEYYQHDRRAILGEISVHNCTDGWFWLDLGQYAVNITDSNGTGGVNLFSSGNSTVRMENVTNSFSYSYASGRVFSYTLRDCGFWGYESSSIILKTADIYDISITNCTFDGAVLGLEAESPHQGHTGLEVSGCHFSGNGSMFYMLWDTYHRDDWGPNPTNFPYHYGTVSGNTFSGNRTGVMLHHALYNGTFVDNTLEEGARAWAWYWTDISPEPERNVGNEHEVHIFPLPGLLTEFPEPFDVYQRDENYYYEVTDQLGGPIEHPQLRVAIHWYTHWGHELVLSDVVSVDLARDSTIITYPVWSDLQGLLPMYIEDWPWRIEGYEGSRW